MIVLANDGIAAGAKKELEALGLTVDTNHYEGADLDQKIKEVDAIVIRSATTIREPLIDQAVGGNLKVMIRAGVGLDNIDVQYAKDKGFEVRNTPSASSRAVAELALGHMFALARYIHISNYEMRNGLWNKKAYKGTELGGKTLGLVGFGRIAQSLATMAKAIGMNVVYYDIVGDVNSDLGSYKTMDELFAVSDYISLHVPFIKSVGTLIGEAEFAKMKDGVMIVDCARGKVMSEAALVKALDSGKVKAAALDVFEEEPTKNDAILNHPKISLTPHIGAQTVEAQDRIGEETVQIIKEILL